MKWFRVVKLPLIASAFSIISACGDDNDAFLPPPTPTETHTATPRPTNTNTAIPTDTRTPTPAQPPTPTETSTVTETPTLTETPGGPTRTPTLSPTATPSPTPSPTSGTAVCGNGRVETGEECDDGNANGGDGCAANCTNERVAECTFGGATGALVQTALFAIELEITGGQDLTVGKARNQVVENTDGETFNAGDVPIIVRPEDMRFDPIPVPGLVCACVRGIRQPELDNQAGKGRAGCGPGGLTNVDSVCTIDHNINDVDPGCTTGVRDTLHPGACNGTLNCAFSGQGPTGSALITTSTSISLLSDGGVCQPTGGNPNIYGPDGEPCTEDDPNQAPPRTLITTTGAAEAAVIDVNNRPGARLDKNTRCGAAQCITTAVGAPIADCALVDTNPTAALAGASIVSAFAAVDSAQIGDNVVTTRFECAAP